MGKYTLVKSKIAKLMMENNVADEKEIMIMTKLAVRKNGSNLSGKVESAEKSTLTSALLQYYTLPLPVDFVVAVRDKTLILIFATKKGLLIEKPSVGRQELERRIEINGDAIVGVTAKKSLGGYKMSFDLDNQYAIIVEVPQRLIGAMNELVTALGFESGRIRQEA